MLQRIVAQVSRVGIYMQSLDDGSVVFSQNADDLLNPASNVKLVTPPRRWRRWGPSTASTPSSSWTRELPADGKVKTLYVRGKGDPSITTERLYGITSELLHAGPARGAGHHHRRLVLRHRAHPARV